MQNRRVTVQELAEEVGISTGSGDFILTDDLAMRERGSCIMTKHQLIPCY
jgi:predicted DNA binding protein